MTAIGQDILSMNGDVSDCSLVIGETEHKPMVENMILTGNGNNHSIFYDGQSEDHLGPSVNTQSNYDSVMNKMKRLWKSKEIDKDKPEKQSKKLDNVESFDTDKMIGRLSSAWNNVKYGWSFKRRQSFDSDFPVWLLGVFYHCKDEFTCDDANCLPGAIEQDFSSRIWLTYRKGFPSLLDSDVHSDTGWGCMIRSGQMMIAQAAILHWLGRDWTRFTSQTYSSVQSIRNILSLFGDSPDRPLSIHTFCKIGKSKLGKVPGDWYGPASTAQVIKDAMQLAEMNGDIMLSPMRVYVATDCAVCLSEIDALMGWGSKDKISPKNNKSPPSPGLTDPTTSWDLCQDFDKKELPTTSILLNAEEKALILIVPLRLGTDKLNRIYEEHIRTLLSVKNCLGLIGGKPKHSMYFVGCHKESLIYLDPHLCQDYVDVNDKAFECQTYFCNWPRKISISEVDPSCAVGFYCPTKISMLRLFDDLAEIIDQEGVKSINCVNRFPLFSVVKNRADHQTLPDTTSSMSGLERMYLAIAEKHANQHGFELL